MKKINIFYDLLFGVVILTIDLLFSPSLIKLMLLTKLSEENSYWQLSCFLFRRLTLSSSKLNNCHGKVISVKGTDIDSAPVTHKSYFSQIGKLLSFWEKINRYQETIRSWGPCYILHE